jgi:phosphotransferase system IIA component
MDLIRYSPLFGPVVPLDDVADPVFTRRRVSDGQRMSKGDLLVEFDVDMIARTAKSLIHRCPGRERQFLSPGKSI